MEAVGRARPLCARSFARDDFREQQEAVQERSQEQGQN